MAEAYLALGSNLGDRIQQLQRAVFELSAIHDTRVTTVSRVYETPPIGGPPDQSAFYNAAVALETDLSPMVLLHHAQAMERKAGRVPPNKRSRCAPRTLDVDILLYDQRVINDTHLSIPHPRMTGRWFVLRPLSDIAEDVLHPVAGKTINQLLNELSTGRYDQGKPIEMDLSLCPTNPS